MDRWIDRFVLQGRLKKNTKKSACAGVFLQCFSESLVNQMRDNGEEKWKKRKLNRADKLGRLLKKRLMKNKKRIYER